MTPPSIRYPHILLAECWPALLLRTAASNALAPACSTAWTPSYRHVLRTLPCSCTVLHRLCSSAGKRTTGQHLQVRIGPPEDYPRHVLHEERGQVAHIPSVLGDWCQCLEEQWGLLYTCDVNGCQHRSEHRQPHAATNSLHAADKTKTRAGQWIWNRKCKAQLRTRRKEHTPCRLDLRPRPSVTRQCRGW